MTDLNLNPSTINLRNKGISTSTGKLHKGCVKDATSKLSIGSIPSPYQSVIYQTQNKKAFGTSQKRFYDKPLMNTTTTEYISQINNNIYFNNPTQQLTKSNYNKLGQNCFISKQKRQLFGLIKTPGPTHYNNHHSQFQSLQKKYEKKSQLIKQELNNNKFNKKLLINTPGPGEYLSNTQNFYHTSYHGCRSSFDSKVTRSGYQLYQTVTPAPGYYEQIKQKDNRTKKRNQNRIGKQNIDENQFLSQFNTNNNKQQPGPGFYNHELPTFKPLYQKIKMSVNFMPPSTPIPNKTQPTPTSTAYQINRIYDNLTPKLISSTFFMSQTKRPFYLPTKMTDFSEINPKPIQHKNFHCNSKKQWIC